MRDEWFDDECVDFAYDAAHIDDFVHAYFDESFSTGHVEVEAHQVVLASFAKQAIWFDDELIRKDGIFVTKDLKGLNPDNLK